jgi:hypothetical protein
MKKIQLIIVFILYGTWLLAQTNLVAYEYWFNGDDANRQVVTIAPVPLHQLSMDVDASTLVDGVNVFNIRYKDENNVFSSTLSRVFYKNTQTLTIDKNLVEYEYWFNNDYANKQVVPITPSIQHQLITSVDASMLAEGVNVFNIRYKDENNVFSSTMSKVFYKNTQALTMDKNLVEYEYWFNNDYENKQVVPIAPSTQHQLTTQIDASELPEGVNVFHIRYKDEHHVFSSTLSKVFYKMNPNQEADNKITAYQYWFDDDFSHAVYTNLATPIQQLNLIDNLDLTQIPKGMHDLHFQFRDENGLWSGVSSTPVEKLSLPIAGFEINSAWYCDSTVVTLVNKSIDGDVYLWDFGDGSTSEEEEPLHTYTAPGDYSIVLTITDTVTGVDSTAIQLLTVETGTTYAAFAASACDHYVSPSGYYVWTATGIYNDTIPNSMGCDSVMTIDLTIDLSTSATLETESCDAYTSPSGNYTWTMSGIYNDTIANTAGCDSVITVNLTILETTFANLTETACDSYTSPSGNYTWTTSGIYFDTIPNTLGCDSVITINLTVNETTYATIDESTCDVYTSPSGNYNWNSSGTYADTIPNVFGCDSILTINLTVIEVDTSVTVTDPTLTANAINADYQWLNCPGMEPIPGATGQSFTATINGWYAVAITQNGCTDTSTCYQVLTVGLQVPVSHAIAVYPNPTSGMIVVDFGEKVSETKLILRDSKGTIVLSRDIFSSNHAKLELKGEKGLYFLEVIQSDSRVLVFKIMKE